MSMTENQSIDHELITLMEDYTANQNNELQLNIIQKNHKDTGLNEGSLIEIVDSVYI